MVAFREIDGSGGPPIETAGDIRACPACRGTRSCLEGYKHGHALRRCVRCRTIAASLPAEGGTLGELYDHYYDRARFEIHPVVAASLASLVRSFEPYRRTGRWLDVGFGEGGLLAAAGARGWACYGTEVAPACLRFGTDRGWTVAADGRDDPRFPPGGFDVVTMIELIEHVPEPDAFLQAAARWLRPGGVLYITTPNAGSLNRRALGLAWSIFSPPEHLTIWSRRGLRHALIRAGLVPRRVRTEGFNPHDLLARVGPRGACSPPGHRNQTGLALNVTFSSGPFRRGLKAGINRCLSAFGVGDSLKVLALRGPESPEA